MAEIILQDLEFFAYHGVYPEEKEQGNTFAVTVIVHGSWEKARQTDRLEDTLDYVQIYQLVEQEMHINSSLLENVVYRINRKLLTTFETIDKVQTTICKKNPPIDGNIHAVCYKDQLTREP